MFSNAVIFADDASILSALHNVDASEREGERERKRERETERDRERDRERQRETEFEFQSCSKETCSENYFMQYIKETDVSVFKFQH